MNFLFQLFPHDVVVDLKQDDNADVEERIRSNIEELNVRFFFDLFLVRL